MTKKTNTFSESDTLSPYFRAISNHELLTRKQEKELAHRDICTMTMKPQLKDS